MRNMSFMLTTEQVRNRAKTVTRRLGWATLKPGTLIRAVEKGMGLKKGETVKPIAVLRVLDVRRECLSLITPDECDREGFPHLSPSQFREMFAASHGCGTSQDVTRIEFEYVEAPR